MARERARSASSWYEKNPSTFSRSARHRKDRVCRSSVARELSGSAWTWPAESQSTSSALLLVSVNQILTYPILLRLVCFGPLLLGDFGDGGRAQLNHGNQRAPGFDRGLAGAVSEFLIERGDERLDLILHGRHLLAHVENDFDAGEIDAQ